MNLHHPRSVERTRIQFYYLLAILVILVLFLTFFSQLLLHTIGPADTRLFLYLNSIHYPYLDQVMYLASDKLFWIPGYLILVLLIVKEFRSSCWKPLLLIGLMILFTDQVSSHLIKQTVARLRPSHETALLPYIHLSKAGPGGLYGFISSHAANAFSLAVFVSLLMRRKIAYLPYILFCWSILVSYSRIYNGVHYPSDVFFAAITGAISGWLFYLVLLLLPHKNLGDTNLLRTVNP